jgi:hypothetical protein
VLGGVDGNLHFPVPSMNRLNQTEPATFSIINSTFMCLLKPEVQGCGDKFTAEIFFLVFIFAFLRHLALTLAVYVVQYYLF